MYYTIYAMK